jgi:hypothetical protein
MIFLGSGVLVQEVAIMVKRIGVVLLGLVAWMMASVAFANYPEYLNGDRNFILCDGHMGTAWYVDRSSLDVQEYAPPQYIIAVKVVSARSATGDEEAFYEHDGAGTITGTETYRFFYNWDRREMYVDRDGTSNWRYLDPWGAWASTGIVMPAGEIAFALAYHLKFYGTQSRYSEYSGTYYHPFTDALYRRI